MRLLYVAPLVAGLFLSTSMATAQRIGVHHGFYGGHVPVYHGLYYGHSNWNYVVPHFARFVGGYYMDGPSYYYTPSPIVPVLTEPLTTTDTPTPPTPVEVQKPVQLTFGAFARYPDLAGRLAMEMNALCLDLHHNYQGNKNFDEAYAEAYSVLQTAKALQTDKSDQSAIAKRVTEAHRQFHHFMTETSGWNRSAKKLVGNDSLDDKSARAEAILHYLLYDVGVKQDNPAAATTLPTVDPSEEAPKPIRR